jgi:hypothetical protein
VNGKPPRTSRTRISPTSTLRTNSNSCAVCCFNSNSLGWLFALLGVASPNFDAPGDGRPRVEHKLAALDSERFKSAVTQFLHRGDKAALRRAQVSRRNKTFVSHSGCSTFPPRNRHRKKYSLLGCHSRPGHHVQPESARTLRNKSRLARIRTSSRYSRHSVICDFAIPGIESIYLVIAERLRCDLASLRSFRCVLGTPSSLGVKVPCPT